jgi:hypothetical protein
LSCLMPPGAGPADAARCNLQQTRLKDDRRFPGSRYCGHCATPATEGPQSVHANLVNRLDINQRLSRAPVAGQA